jgi:hypothetical protein
VPIPVPGESEENRVNEECYPWKRDAEDTREGMGDVTKDGKTFPRFTKITDPATIAELERIREEMY